MCYLITHEGKAYSPDGLVPGLTADAAPKVNADIEALELEALRAGVERATLYVRKRVVNKDGAYQWQITTWLGTVVSTSAYAGARVRSGFGGAYRRHIEAFIMGRWYSGWYYESSGDYCRLKLAKRNCMTKGPNNPAYGPWKLG